MIHRLLSLGATHVHCDQHAVKAAKTTPKACPSKLRGEISVKKRVDCRVMCRACSLEGLRQIIPRALALAEQKTICGFFSRSMRIIDACQYDCEEFKNHVDYIKTPRLLTPNHTKITHM